MNSLLKNSVKRILTGLSFSQEYLCIDKNHDESSLTVLCRLSSNEVDVTDSHLFLGYKPLIIGIVGATESERHLLTSISELQLEFRSASRIKIALLKIRKINHLEVGDHRLFFYEGIYGSHRFINSFHQLINRQKEKFRISKLSGADLYGNNYDQVRIAYSIPRTISVVTVSDGERINMFPTDLHGAIGNDFYVSSLRTGGMATSQVEKYRTIVLSEVSADQFQKVYRLGKNHMKDLCDRSEFDTDERTSSTFGFPLPKGVIGYRELQLVRSFDHGIHRIHLYKIQHHERLEEDDSLLAHVHHYYAQWRVDNALKTDFLIR